MFQIKDQTTGATLEKARRYELLGGNCWMPDCGDQGVVIIYDRVRKVFCWFCEKHSEYILNYTRPESIEECPACGCQFGVN